MFTGSLLQEKKARYLAKKHRVNTIVKKTASLPRLLVLRSLSHISAQIIGLDGTIVAAATDYKLTGTKSEKALAVGKLVAEHARKVGVTAVVFDRNGYLYHGRVKNLADGAREGGLSF